MTSPCNNKELKILPEKFSKMPFPQEFYYYIMKNMQTKMFQVLPGHSSKHKIVSSMLNGDQSIMPLHPSPLLIEGVGQEGGGGHFLCCCKIKKIKMYSSYKCNTGNIVKEIACLASFKKLIPITYPRYELNGYIVNRHINLVHAF